MHKFPVASPPFPQCLSCVPFVVFRGHHATPAGKLPPRRVMHCDIDLTQMQGRTAALCSSPATSPWGPSPAADVLMQHTRPHKISAWGNTATGRFVPHFHLHFMLRILSFETLTKTGRPQKSPVAVSALTFLREDKKSLMGYSSLLPPPTPSNLEDLPG